MQFRKRLTQALREPLVHFLLAGLAIFLIYGSFGGAVDSSDRRIAVTEEQVKRLQGGAMLGALGDALSLLP